MLVNYRNFTKRCPHGFAVGIIGCEECGTEVPDMVSQHLRRAAERRAATAVVPSTYKPRSGDSGKAARGWRE